MTKRQKTMAIVVLMLVFTTLFLHNTKSDFGLIFKKDLLAHDESSNSVVAANITRKFFPPMVRVNPLNPTQGNWMEGPYWQHIPPLFAYVPYLFFKLDGQITIEVKRLSYALLTLLTGLLFIFGVYKFRKDLWVAAAATLAAIFWLNTPFTHELITGYAFGVSDIVLGFTVVLAFCAILWYLDQETLERLQYPFWKLSLIGLAVALPIIAKNILGAIPAATLLGLLIWDYRKFNKQIAVALSAGIALCSLYFLPLYFSSPATFNNEILLSFNHFKSLEGWQRPWHWYVTNYLPQRYLGRWTALYYFLLVAGLLGLAKRAGERKDQILLWLSGGWFVWNLVAISAVTSKVPNFIYQSYLLSLFFIAYTLTIIIKPYFEGPLRTLGQKLDKSVEMAISVVLIASVFTTGYETIRFGLQFKVQRAQAYNYQSEHEKFYQLAEKLRARGLDTRDLVILNNPPEDCWERYYILFLTGTESKTLLEMYFNTVPLDVIARQYPNIYLIDSQFQIQRIQINDLSGILETNDNAIQSEIRYIKQDKTSCQWLVPDPILNAP